MSNRKSGSLSWAPESILVAALNKVPDVILILNQDRTIVFCNQAALSLFEEEHVSQLRGKRLGEVLKCINSVKSEMGCGSSLECQECGSVHAFLGAQEGKDSVKECQLRVIGKETEMALSFRVWASQLPVEGNVFTVLTIKDIENEKHRELLERTFFHDVLNDLGVLQMAAHLLQESQVSPNPNEALLNQSMARLIEHVHSQRDFLHAEEGHYVVVREQIEVRSFLSDLKCYLEQATFAKGKKIDVQIAAEDTGLLSDEHLLHRCLLNLMKNALESSKAGPVTVSFMKQNKEAVFSVHNPEVMPSDVQRNIFYRFYSTKGKGRGIGTYSVKLFIERYLKGLVSFESCKGKGTTFYISLPSV